MIRYENNYFESGKLVLHGGLQDPTIEDMAEEREKALKVMDRFRKFRAFTVYMGQAKDEIECLVWEARKHGVEVHVLESIEAWGYDFIAIRSNEFVVDGETFRYNPFNDMSYTKSWNSPRTI